MACDIHLHVEIEIDGRWHHYNHSDVDRNYALFSKMAGVRGGEEPIALPRGVPGDITVVTRLDLDRWGCDAHSMSWLNASEIAELQEWSHWNTEDLTKAWTMFGVGFLFGNSYKGFVKYPDERPPGLEDVRFVFWFDN